MTRARDLSSILAADGSLNISTSVNLADNEKAYFGTSNDLQIYHDGSNSYISDQGTGNLLILSDANSGFQNASATEWKVEAATDGAVKLYYDGNEKLATAATGLNLSGDLNLVGRGTSHSLRSPDWRVYTDINNSFVWDDYSQTRMSLNPVGHLTTNGDVRTQGQVRATGWAGSSSTSSSGMGVEIGMSGGVGFMLVYDRDNSTYGNLKVNVNTSAAIDTTAGGGAIVMNDGGNNTDFRVESDTKPYALFVHGNSGLIGVDNNSPSSFNALGNSSHIVIGDGSASTGLTCFSNPGNGYGSIAFADGIGTSAAQYAGLIQYTHANNTMNFYTNANFHTVMQDGYITSRQTGNGHETVQYLRSNGTYTHVKTNIYRNGVMYYIKVVGAGGYAGENTLSLLTGYAYAPYMGTTNSAYHGTTNLGNYAISDVYYSSDNFLCFTINSNYYGQYTVTMSSHATSYNSTAPNLIAASVGNTSTARYYA